MTDRPVPPQTPGLREALEAVRFNLLRAGYETNSIMIEGIDAALGRAAAAITEAATTAMQGGAGLSKPAIRPGCIKEAFFSEPCLAECKDSRDCASKAPSPALDPGTVEAAAAIVDNYTLAIIPDQCSTRDTLKFAKGQIAAKIRALASPAPGNAEQMPRPDRVCE